MNRPRSTASALGATFCARGALELAPALLGHLLVHETEEGRVAGRIVEVEAYCGPGDLAAHSANGRRTPRNASMWGPAGRAYVYRIYGLHHCLNVVAAREGVPEAVLVRACEVVEGEGLAGRRRGRDVPPRELLRGPGNLCRGLGVTLERDGVSLARGPLTLRRGSPFAASAIGTSERIGVAYAGADAARPWRFFVRGHPAVSGPTRLRR